MLTGFLSILIRKKPLGPVFFTGREGGLHLRLRRRVANRLGPIGRTGLEGPYPSPK